MTYLLILLALEGAAVLFFLFRWRIERKINIRTAFITTHFSNLLANNKRIEELMWDVTQHCIPVLGLEDCVIYIKQKDGNFIQAAAFGPKAEIKGVESPMILKAGQGIVGECVSTGQIMNIQNTSKHPSYIPDDKIRLSELCVPIICNGEVKGVIDSENSRPRFYKKYHERLFMVIAMLCSTKIEEIESHERAEVNQQFAQKYNYLRELDRMKTDFVRSVSHDLKSPLTLMSIRLDELQAHGMDKSAEKVVRALRDNFQAFESVLDQMMELNEIESGNTTLKSKSIQPEELLKEWGLLYEGSCSSSQLDLQISLHDLPNVWITDQSKLQRVVMNLLGNAIKFTAAHGVVKLEGYVEDELLYISVFNSGAPIDDKHLPHLFEKFYQGEASQMGSGLGLHICKSLVELLGGDIWITTSSSGNTFEFRIPSLVMPTGEEVEQAPIQLQTDIPVALIVEDHAELRATLAESLMSDYQVITAAEGRAALKLCHRWQPDIVVSDLKMPGMDGLSFVEELRKDSRTDHIPVIIVTARGSFDDRMELMGYGVDLVFNKPYVMSELKASMSRLIERNKKSDNLEPNLDAPSRVFLEDLHAFLDDHLSNPELNNSHLEEHFSLGRNALLRKMRSIVECSPAEYTLKYRLERSLELLKSDNQSIKEVAYQCGFNHPSYFTKAFKKHFGYPPSEVDKAYT